MSHIQSAALKMNFIELHNLDVYIIIFLIFMLLLSAPVYFVKKLYLACHRKVIERLEKPKKN